MIPDDVLSVINETLGKVLQIVGHPEQEIPEYIAILHNSVVQLASTYLIMEMPAPDRLAMLTSLQQTSDPKKGLTIIFSYKHPEERLLKAFEDGMRDVVDQYFQKVLPTLTEVQKHKIKTILLHIA